MKGRRPDAVAVLCVVLGVAVLTATTALRPQGPWGDQALIQMATDRAARLGQLLGPYSRFGWSHPGPLYFYLLAGPYKLLGSSQRALAASSVMLSGLWALLAVLTADLTGGRRVARWTAGVALLELAALGPAVVGLVWNPVAVTVPVLTLLLAGTALARGRWWALPVLVITGSFLAETDISTAVLVAVVGVVALVLALLGRVKGRRSGDDGADGWWAGGRRGGGRLSGTPTAAVAAALVAGALCWSAPVLEELEDHPGNLTLLVRFFTHSHQSHSLAASARAVAGALWPPLAGRLSAGPPAGGTAAAVLGGAVALGATATMVGRLRRRPVATALAVMGLVAVAAGVASAMRATGPLYAYLVEWDSAAGAALLLAAVLAVLPERWVLDDRQQPAGLPHRGGRPPRWSPSLLAPGLAGLGLVLTSAWHPIPASAGGRQVETLWTQLAPALRPGPVLLRIAPHGRWPWAAGLAVELTHAGHPTVVEPGWLFLFGSQFRAPPGFRPREVVCVWQPGTGAAPPGRRYARSGSTSVFVSYTTTSG